MSASLVIFYYVLLLTSFGVLARQQLDSTKVVPIHYNIDLSLDLANNKFQGEGSISISVLKKTNEISLFRENSLLVTWSTEPMLISDEDGQGYKSNVHSSQVGTDFVTYYFLTDFPPGNYTLMFRQVQGTIGLPHSGFQRVPLLDKAGKSVGQSISSGFNITNFRAIFPCFDDPQFRTTFNFTLSNRGEYHLISNTEEVERKLVVQAQENLYRHHFDITEPTLVSSLSLVLTPMQKQSSLDGRVNVYHVDQEMAKTLSVIYNDLLLAVEDELGVALERPELNVVYTPTLPTNFLVKRGFIAIGSEMVPVLDFPLYSVQLKAIQKEIATSVYQLFFGQLISPSWWTEQWITLGLARYFSGVTKHLPFDAEKEFLVDTVQMVIREQNASVPDSMNQWYYHLHEINNPNMFVVDQRAGAFMRLLAHVVGNETFKDAICDFLQTNAGTSITTQMFINHIDLYGKGAGNTKLSEIIDRYINARPKINTVQVYKEIRNYVAKRITTEDVDVPIEVMSSNGSFTQFDWMTQFYSWLPLLDVEFEEPFVVLNPRQTGLYSVDYTGDLWQNLIDELLFNHELFNREQLMSDSLNLVVQGQRSISTYMNITTYLPMERDLMPWKVAGITFESLEIWLRGADTFEFYKHFRNVTADVYSLNPFGSTTEDFELSYLVAKIACGSGNRDCVEDVEKYYEENEAVGISGPNDYQSFIYCTLVRHSSGLWDFNDRVMKLWIKDRNLNSESRNAMKGLACTGSEDVINDWLDIAISDRMLYDHAVIMSAEERAVIIKTFISGSHESVLASLKFIFDNYEAVADHVPSMEDLFAGVGFLARTQPQLDALKGIAEVHAHKMSKELLDLVVRESVIGSKRLVESQHIIDDYMEWANERKEDGEPDSAVSVQAMNFILLFGTGILMTHLFSI